MAADLLARLTPGARVVVWGFGRHGGGAAAARFCAARGAAVTVLDAKPASDFPGDSGAHAWPWLVGDGTHACLRDCDLIVASPAIAPRAWPAEHAPATCPEGLFFAAHRGPRIAVTGTKGKSTTSALIAGLSGWQLAGNGWTPLLDALAAHGPDAPVVCELSSFQCWYLREQQPPFTATVLTNLAVDHLDWHPTVAHYHAAKQAMLTWGREQIHAATVRVTCTDGWFRTRDGAVLAARSDLAMPGEHNAANACLAISAAVAVGVPAAQIAARLRAIAPLPHRLQPVFQQGSLRFIDDSIATVPEATLAALAAIDGPLAVILGGSDKGADFSALAQAMAREWRSRGARAFTIGSTGARVAAAICAAGGEAVVCGELRVAIERAAAALPDGGSVLLSPACASFDQFTGFEHRGRCFAELARARGA